jgi:hypothetical protein
LAVKSAPSFAEWAGVIRRARGQRCLQQSNPNSKVEKSQSLELKGNHVAFRESIMLNPAGAISSLARVCSFVFFNTSPTTQAAPAVYTLDGLALALLGLLQGLHVAVQSMSVVSAELGVGTLEGGVTGSLGLLDAIAADENQRPHVRRYSRFQHVSH